MVAGVEALEAPAKHARKPAAPADSNELSSLWFADAQFRLALAGSALAWFGYNCYAYGIICYYPELTASILGKDVRAVLVSAILAGVAQFVAAVGSVARVPGSRLTGA